MKIPKTVAKWMAISSAVMTVATPLLKNYLINKKEEALNNSPTYMGAKDIEEKLPKYEKDLAQCFPRVKDTSALEKCVTLANEYDVLESKLTNLKADPEYISTMEKADSLMSYANHSAQLSVFFFIPLLVGWGAYRNRKLEELENQSKGEQ